MSRAALLFVGATVAAGCAGKTQAGSAPSDGRSDAGSTDGGSDDTPSEGGGNDWDGRVAAFAPVQDSGPIEASPDASTDAPSDATGTEDANYWELLPPTSDGMGPPQMSAVNYGPAFANPYNPTNPLSAPQNGPAAFNPGSAVKYGPAIRASSVSPSK